MESRVKIPLIGKDLNKILGKGLGIAVKSNLDTIGDPGRERNILQNEQMDRATGRDPRKRVNPSFTIGRW